MTRRGDLQRLVWHNYAMFAIRFVTVERLNHLTAASDDPLGENHHGRFRSELRQA